jgi:RHS repeat-associated protein
VFSSPGQHFDATIDLYNYNARFYDPQLGQCTQPDSLIPQVYNPIALNRSAYVYNSPGLKHNAPH